MVPRQSRLGSSFVGAGKYYLHDREANTSERVAFTHCENIPTQNPEKALKWMAFTAIHAEEIKREAGTPATGKPCEKPVFTFSLSWHPEQELQKWEMVGAGRGALAALGLEGHETVFVGHSDGVPHVHVIVNTIHPETGKVNTLSYSKLKLSKWAESYERDHGHVYCEQRVDNNARREEGEYVEYQEPQFDFKAHITQLYHASDSGKAFQTALAEAGYKLAQGKRIVVIDSSGKVHSLSRQIDGVKAKDIRAKLADLELPLIDESRSQSGNQTTKTQNNEPEEETQEAGPEKKQGDGQQEKNTEPEYFDRDAQDRAWQESIVDAALNPGNAPTLESKPQPKQPTPARALSPAMLNALQDRHLAELGNLYDDNMRAKAQLRSRLEKEYGEHERKLRGDAERLDGVLKNSGAVRTWWLKLTGQLPKTAEQDLANMRLTLENIEWRQNEARHALDAEIAQSSQTLEVRHRQEKEALPYAPDHSPPPAAEAYSGEIREGPEPEEDFGPSLGY